MRSREAVPMDSGRCAQNATTSAARRLWSPTKPARKPPWPSRPILRVVSSATPFQLEALGGISEGDGELHARVLEHPCWVGTKIVSEPRSVFDAVNKARREAYRTSNDGGAGSDMARL